MPSIHPTAILGPSVELAEDVTVGPMCILEGNIRIGQGTRLIAQVYLHGEVTLGAENVLYPGVRVGFEPQSRRWNTGQTSAGVTVGHRNVFREGVTIHHATTDEVPTTVGNDNFLMTNSHLGHDVQMGNRCTLATGAVVGGHAQIADLVNIGGNGTVHQFARVGRMAMIGGLSGVSSDLPPFATASGINTVISVNAIGLRRSGADKESIEAVGWAFRTLMLGSHTNPVAVDLIRHHAAQVGPQAAALLEEIADFVSLTKRGLVPHSLIAHRQKLRR